MIRKVLTAYQIAEARNQLKNVTPIQATFATILEAGCTAFYKGYYGAETWAKGATEAKASDMAHDDAMTIAEAYLTDVTSIHRTLREAHTTTDFPLILANIRQGIVRDQVAGVNDSFFWEMAEKRVAPDFKIMRSYKVTGADELVLRSEGEDVELTTITMTGDGYSVANYERGIKFTWEMWKNDDLSVLTIGMKRLGELARKTRAKVALGAIKSGVQAITLGGSAGGPTIERVTALVQRFAEKMNAQGDIASLDLTDIVFPAKWKLVAKETLESQYLIGPTANKQVSNNIVAGVATPHLDRLMASVLGADWIGYDGSAPFLEVATLDDFQDGPKTYTQVPDCKEEPNQGSFSNHSFAIKVGDAVGSKVFDTDPIERVAGG